MLNAVGTVVSKGRSTVAVLQHSGIVVKKPLDVPHSVRGLEKLNHSVSPGSTKAVLE